MEFLIANILITGVNLLILALTLKLYTEYFKDKSIGSKLGNKMKDEI